ncbi:MAG: putative metal-binding motif-containing protein [Myxococcota bacterium]
MRRGRAIRRHRHRRLRRPERRRCPNAAEVCNGVNDDCDGLTDEAGAGGYTTYFLDADGDKAGVTGQTLCLCSAQAACSALVGGDCADGDARRPPGKTELCNGIDDDCDGQTDEVGATGCVQYWADVDDDGYGQDGNQAYLCAPIGDFTAIRGGDCDDSTARREPALTETCVAIDDDCDGLVDEVVMRAPSIGWPTFMGNTPLRPALHRRGPDRHHERPLLEAPARRRPSLRGTRRSSTRRGASSCCSARRWQLDAATGAIRYGHGAAQVAYPRASPTVRVGGTILAPNGNGVTLVSATSAIIWTPAAARPTTWWSGAPLVDNSGRIFVVSNTHVHELRSDGGVAWATAITSTAAHPSTPRWARLAPLPRPRPGSTASSSTAPELGVLREDRGRRRHHQGAGRVGHRQRGRPPARYRSALPCTRCRTTRRAPPR